MIILRAQGLEHWFRSPQQKVLKGIDLQIDRGEFVAIEGQSGSGKSTLLYILGTLLKPKAGTLEFCGQDLFSKSKDRAEFRNRHLGFVFQNFHLLPELSALDNILMPTQYPIEYESVETSEEYRKRALALAKRVGIEAILEQKPGTLSGGQAQRVALCRALIMKPDLILADEPTGSLDSGSAEEILKIFKELNDDGQTIVMITHDREVATRARRRIRVKDGLIESDSAKPRAELGNSAEQPSTQTRRRSRLQLLAALTPDVIKTLAARKTRSFLTGLGVVMGVAAVLAMMTLGSFIKTKIIANYEELGVNRIQFSGWPNWRQRASSKSLVQYQNLNWSSDVEPLFRLFPEIKRLSPYLRLWGTSLTYGGRSMDGVDTGGVSESFFAISNWPLVSGRPLNQFHIANRSAVCVIGSEVNKRLFDAKPAVGQPLFVSHDSGTKFACTVIGVLAARHQKDAWDKPNEQIFVPHSFFQSVSAGWYNRIRMLQIQLNEGSDPELFSKKIQGLFKLKYGDTGIFDASSDATLVAQMKRFLSMFTVLMTGLGLLSLVVGCTGIGNMMMATINERLRELGLRKALGATGRSLRYQVLTESAILVSVSGLLGLLIGFALYQSLIWGASVVMKQIEFEWVVNLQAIALSLVAMVVAAIAAGLVPAIRAQKLDIVEALRSD